MLNKSRLQNKSNKAFKKNSKQISLICPTKNNLTKIKSLARKLKKLAKNENSYELVIVIDDNDLSYTNLNADKLNICICKSRPKKNISQLLKTRIKNSCGKVIMFMNDDVTPKTKNWDNIILQLANRYQDEIFLIHCNDGYFKESLCIFPIISRKLINLCPKVLLSKYKKYRIDDGIFHIFNMLTYAGFYREHYIDSLVFEHNHFSLTKNNASYKPIESIHKIDSVVFHQQKKQRIAYVK